MAHHRLHAEKEILTQVAAGDEKAFKTLFTGYYQQLFNYINAFIKSKQAAEELAMDIFLKLWEGRHLVPRIRDFNAFLFRVAHNKCIDFLRSVARDPKFEDLLWETLQLQTSQRDSSALVQEYELRLREAIALLPPKQKQVYQLSREQDMTHDQIAAHLQLSPHTINNHIVQAQRTIRSYISQTCDIAFLVCLLVMALP